MHTKYIYIYLYLYICFTVYIIYYVLCTLHYIYIYIYIYTHICMYEHTQHLKINASSTSPALQVLELMHDLGYSDKATDGDPSLAVFACRWRCWLIALGQAIWEYLVVSHRYLVWYLIHIWTYLIGMVLVMMLVIRYDDSYCQWPYLNQNYGIWTGTLPKWLCVRKSHGCVMNMSQSWLAGPASQGLETRCGYV